MKTKQSEKKRLPQNQTQGFAELKPPFTSMKGKVKMKYEVLQVYMI